MILEIKCVKTIFLHSINIEKNLISLTLKNTDVNKASKIITETYTDSFDINSEQNTLNLTLKRKHQRYYKAARKTKHYNFAKYKMS